MTKLLPKRLHVAAVGFAAAVGASGATVLPFLVGAVAQSKGVVVRRSRHSIHRKADKNPGLTTHHSSSSDCDYIDMVGSKMETHGQ